jgi:hypothetical protein
MGQAAPEDSTQQAETPKPTAAPRETKPRKATRKKGQGAPPQFDDTHLLLTAAEYRAWPKETGVTTIDLALRKAVACIAGSDKWAPSRVKSTIDRLRKKYRKVGQELEAASRNRGALPVDNHRDGVSDGATGVAGGTAPTPPPLLCDLSFGLETPNTMPLPWPSPGPRILTGLPFGPEAPDVALSRSHSANLLNGLGRAKRWIGILEEILSEQRRTDATINPALLKHIRRLISVIEGEHERVGTSWEELLD